MSAIDPTAFDQGLQPDVPAAFDYKGRSITERPWSGYIDGATEDEAERKLAAAGITAEDIKPHRLPSSRRKKVRRREIANFAGSLATRIRAEQTVPVACAAIAKTTSHPMLRAALVGVADAISKNGLTSPEAFRLFPDVFPESFCNRLQVGEKNGMPDVILEQYRDDVVKADKIYRKIKGATIYPAAVLGIATIVVLVMMIFVLPQMQNIYNDLLGATGGQLPLPTRILISVSNFLASVPGAITLAGAAAGLVGAWRWTNTGGREWKERNIIHLPLVGQLQRDYNASQAVRTIATLADVTDMDDTLKEAAGSAENVVYREMLEDVREAIPSRGASLSVAFAPHPYLMGPDFLSVVETAETGGRIDVHYRRYADELDEKVTQQIENMMRLMEPVMLLFVGSVIGAVVIAAYLPLFVLLGHLSKP